MKSAPSESIQDLPRHQTLITKEIYYPRGAWWGAAEAAAASTNKKSRRASKETMVFPQDWVSKGKKGESVIR